MGALHENHSGQSYSKFNYMLAGDKFIASLSHPHYRNVEITLSSGKMWGIYLFLLRQGIFSIFDPKIPQDII